MNMAPFCVIFKPSVMLKLRVTRLVTVCPAGKVPTSILREVSPLTLILEALLLTVTSAQTLWASALPLLLSCAVMVRDKPLPLISVMPKLKITLPPEGDEGDGPGVGVGLVLGAGAGVGLVLGAGAGAGDVLDQGTQPRK